MMNNKQNYKAAPAPTSSFSNMSLRSKLILSNLLIAFLAIIGTTYYILNRTQSTNAYLMGQLNQTVFQDSENRLKSSAVQNTIGLNNFFEIIINDLTSIGITTQSLLSQETELPTEGYSNTLIQLPQGSWDNPNSDKASIFVASRFEIPDAILSELYAIRQIDFIAPAILKKNPDIIAVYFGSLRGETLYYPNIDLATILPSDFDITQRPWFTVAEPTNNPDRKIGWSIPYQDATVNGLVVTSSIPVYDNTNRFRGVVAMDVQLTKINDLVSKIRIGKTGYAFLIDKKGKIIAMPKAGYADFGVTPEEVPSGETLQQSLLEMTSLEAFQVLIKMTTSQSGFQSVKLNGVEKYVAYHPLPSINYSLGLVVPQDEMDTVAITTSQRVTSATAGTLRNTIIIVFGVLAVSLLGSLWVGNTISFPLTQLTNIARQITAGDLNATALEQTGDEIGVLANSLNTMTTRIRELINSLEERVKERTSELDTANQSNLRRARQFESISQVIRAISSIQDLGTLLPQITQVISEQFNTYHAGIFLLDDNKEFAVLRAANSEGGQKMLTRRHKLQVGQTGIVGFVTATGQPRIALDVGADAVFFDNPDLPDTRSEIALPLRYAGQVIGALDVQSTESGAFGQDDVEVLVTLADQISIAINNTLILEESRKAFAESQNRFSETTLESWKVMQPKSMGLGFQLVDSSIKPLEKPLEGDYIQEVFYQDKPISSSTENMISNLAIPIRLRGKVIGIMNLRSRNNYLLTQDDADIAEAVSERLSLAIETATLLQSTQHRADIERVTTDISSKISSSTRFETIFQVAAQELSRALGGSDVLVQIEPAAMKLSSTQ